MINQAYRLTEPRRFEITYLDTGITSEKVIVRPLFLSLCNADIRYYTGNRTKEALKKKLPMALIHEAVGEVVFDATNQFKSGDLVSMIPNMLGPTKNEIIAPNYDPQGGFMSSGYDGFMQDYVAMIPNRLIKLPKGFSLEVASFIELISVAMHTISRFDKKAHSIRARLGVWGDGNLGYITALLLKYKFPQSEIYVFGKHNPKLDYFSFVKETFLIDEIPESLKLDHCFEVTGGQGSKYAIDQIIEHINPEGAVALMGVSEYPIEMNTRMILEKGLTFFGSSRSDRIDFELVIQMIQQNPELTSYFEKLVGSIHSVKNIEDIVSSFETELTKSWGKTIMKWDV
ncbi:alcohol dehydrogenase catalytic domain-containing protein [Carnobacterium maltaromaticum]|uniref:alcohol dehydrogenase catalytic domain-containing protein n=1 Tax=Carnobacterium maltaromaticum TaxID=2751 RepID=UPI0012FA809C|nr:alcohol dehydrogenase catalytic domain-containing protein [Carnobacterium maltaromaticum]